MGVLFDQREVPDERISKEVLVGFMEEILKLFGI